MPIFRNTEQTVLYIHIPKTGGTSVENSFIDAGWEYDWLVYPARDNVPDVIPCNPQHYHINLIDMYIDCNIDVEFATVRNPLHRMMSEFRWQTNIEDDSSNEFFAAFEKFMITRMYEYKNIERHYNFSPADYINRKLSFPFDNHMRPQADFVRDNTIVFKLEEIDKLTQFLQQFGIDSLPQDNFTNKNKNLITTKFSEEFKNLYSSIYFVDHEKFNYEKPF